MTPRFAGSAPGRLGLASFMALLMFASATHSQTLVRSAYSGGAVAVSDGTIVLRATVGEVGVVGTTVGGGLQVGEGFWPGTYRLVATGAPETADLASEISFENGLWPSVPNPFRASTEITYTIGAPSPVRITVHDVAGRLVAVLTDDARAPGRYVVTWDGRDRAGRLTASGVYFSRLTVGSWSHTRKMLRVR